MAVATRSLTRADPALSPTFVNKTKDNKMSIQQHIQELRLELRNCIDPEEREQIRQELEQIRQELEVAREG